MDSRTLPAVYPGVYFCTVKNAYTEAKLTYLNSGNFNQAGADAAVKGKDRPVTASLEELNKNLEKYMYEIAAKSEATLNDYLFFGLFAGLSIIVIILLTTWFVLTNITNKLSGISGKSSDVVQQVLSASLQLSSASQSLSSSATESSSSLEETVSALEELSSTVKMNADNAKEAASLTANTNKTATDGEREIKNLISSMGEIAAGSKKIEEIINVIDDIAFQTNLLALNAAVEAARAGEQGKGFAVVAEAVRALAQRSASAAKDITSLIKESVEKSERGSNMADKSGVVLQNIVASIKKVSELNNEIAAASQEQSRGIGQISKAMNELDQPTQKNAALAEEVAASGEELSAQSLTMQDNVKDLNHVITGEQTEVALKELTNKPSQHIRVNTSNLIPLDDDLDIVKKIGTAKEF